MALNLSGVQRPKLNPSVSYPVELTVQSPSENDTTDSFAQYVTYQFTPDPQTIVCSAANGSDKLTIASSDQSKVRVGDAVTGTGIAANTVVTAVSGTQVTLDKAVTAAINNGNITFTAPATTAKLFGLTGTFSPSGSVISLTIKGYRADGNTTGGAGGVDATTVGNMSEQFSQTIRLDLDAFLQAARKARTN